MNARQKAGVGVGSVLGLGLLVGMCSAPSEPTPKTDAVGTALVGAGYGIAGVADDVKRVPKPVPVPGTKSADPNYEPQPRPKPKPAPEAKPAPKPAPKPQPAPTAKPKPASTYYKNCDAARAANADPVYRGEPGYRPALDRDDDGVGCE